MTVSDEERSAYCDTLFPVILVSGLGFTEHHALYDYWGSIPDHLKSCGAAVFTARQGAFSSHVDNAAALKQRIEEVFEKTGKDRINIIGHSKGGLEARYMISRMDMGHAVASLTTLGTPHHGSALADIIVGQLPVGQLMLSRLVNLFARVMGDPSPDSLRAALSVTTEAMAQFNEEVADDPRVHYQSFAGCVDKNHNNLLARTLATMLMPFEGPNDGMVSIKSAQWGEYRGLIRDERCSSVSHGDMIGLSRVFGGYTRFDYNAFAANVVHELIEKGF